MTTAVPAPPARAALPKMRGNPNPAELTPTQRAVWDFVVETLAITGTVPTLREIVTAFEWSSTQAANCHVKALVRKGWLVEAPGKARSLALPGIAQAIAPAVRAHAAKLLDQLTPKQEGGK